MGRAVHPFTAATVDTIDLKIKELDRVPEKIEVMEARDVAGVKVEEGTKEGEETISSNDLGKGRRRPQSHPYRLLCPTTAKATELSDGSNSRLSKQPEYQFLASIAPRVKQSHMYC